MSNHANLALFVPHNGCPQRCVFCNQVRISGKSAEPTADEVRRLCEEHLGKNTGKDCEIAFFGGSFTAIRREYMLELLGAGSEFVKQGLAKGIRISTRPDAIDNEILNILLSHGVTAVELGAQSMDDGVLALNRRGHTADDVRNSAGLIKSAGLELGLQMMIGMYGESDYERSALHTANELLKLSPDTVRIYPAIVVENTEMCELYEQGKYIPLSLEQAVEITSRLLMLFYENNVRVIRAGLHSDKSLIDSAKAGPFHPAFRELCEARIMRRAIESLLVKKPAGRYTVLVAEKGESRAVGNRRENIEYFKKMGFEVAVKAAGGLGRYEVKLYSGV